MTCPIASWVLMPLLPVLLSSAARADIVPAPGATDNRIRSVSYSSEQVYRLYGYVGYQIDLQFEADEHFVGLGAGDIEGIAFVAEANHLFVKPKVASVGTNVTVLTDKRHYQFDYTASARRPDARTGEVIYAVRFLYTGVPESPEEEAARTERALAAGSGARARNLDYGFCGHPSVKPIAASDDGVHTRLRFATRAEQPAIFVRAEDGSESLLNFSMEDDEVVIHRVARQFIVRRGKLTGCIVNKGFTGTGDRLNSNTVSGEVERATKETRP